MRGAVDAPLFYLLTEMADSSAYALEILLAAVPIGAILMIVRLAILPAASVQPSKRWTGA